MRKRRKVIPKIRAPRGFFFRIQKEFYDRKLNNVMVILHDSSTRNKIGHVNLVKCGIYMETHSFLEDAYHERKLGALMYTRAFQWALENGFRVRDGGASEQAQRVWRGNTIRKHFKIRIYKNSIDRENPNYDHFFAYAKGR